MTERWTPEDWRRYQAKKDAALTSKYKAVPCQSADGQKFRSQVERDFYNTQWARQQAGEVLKIEREVRFEFHVNGVYINDYLLDFRLTLADGTLDHVDTKSSGTLTPLFIMKKRLMLACHNIEVREVYAPKEEFNPRRKRGEKK